MDSGLQLLNNKIIQQMQIHLKDQLNLSFLNQNSFKRPIKFIIFESEFITKYELN